MKPYYYLRSLLLVLSGIASTSVVAIPTAQAQAVSFQEEQVKQHQFAVVAVPFGYQEHRLEIIEQVSGEQQCWSESGAAPVNVDLLLLDFDHTDSCRRVINTNGYTLRLDGEDDRVARIVKIISDGNELKLVAFHKDPTQPAIEIGSTKGLSDSAMKISLNPGWQITKRVHAGQVVDHLYLSRTGTNNITYNSPATTTNPQVSPTQPEIDTKAVLNGVGQIYNGVVAPILQDLSSTNTTQQ